MIIAILIRLAPAADHALPRAKLYSAASQFNFEGDISDSPQKYIFSRPLEYCSNSQYTASV